MKKQSFSDHVIQWQKCEGRKHLPWQQNPNKYRVWVSEIMLQQTQVATVLKYYNRFIFSFPDVKTLANEHIDEILHKWSGLGYYRRARLMHKAAQMIINKLNGRIPSTVEGLMELPGIGRSTAGAIVSLSLNKEAVILDANVKKILIRFFGIKSALNEKGTEKKLWELAAQSLPKKEFRHYNQGLMDLGATICFKSNPRCEKELTSFIYKVSNKECHVNITILKGQQDKLGSPKNGNMWCDLLEIKNIGTSSLVKKIASKITTELLDQGD